MTDSTEPTSERLDFVSTVSEAITVLLQAVKESLMYRNPVTGKIIFPPVDISTLGQAIDFLTGTKRPTPKIQNINEAVNSLIQGAVTGLEYGVFADNIPDARLIAEAIEFLTVPSEPPAPSGSKGDFTK